MGLEQFAEEIEVHALARPMPEPPRDVVLPEYDEEPDTVPEHLGDAEGQSFMIEYVDSGGRLSSRRITVYGLSHGHAGVPLLMARCHERKATRYFRVDRIRCCIDYGGEVHDDVAAFLFDNFGMSLSLAQRKADSVDGGRWAEILGVIRDDAVLLAAMSQSDGAVHASEVDAAARYLARLVEQRGIFLTDGEVETVGAHFRRLRPTGDAIRRALRKVEARDPEPLRRLLMAAVDVLDADGKRHPSELNLLNTMCIELTGAAIA